MLSQLIASHRMREAHLRRIRRVRLHRALHRGTGPPAPANENENPVAAPAAA
ncbi:MAG: hypothetical protein ACFBQW_08235 [Sphingomonadaceae bacterium]